MSDERRQGQPKPPSEEPVRKPGPASEYDLSRQKKVESFQLNLDLDEGEDQNFGLPPVEELPKEEPPASAEGQPSEILSSYSEEYAEKKKKAMTAEERKAEKQALKAEKKRNKKKAKKNGCLFKMIWAVMIVLVSVVLAQYILVGVNDIFAINRLDEETISVELPKDASVEEVAGILADKGVINRADFFTLYAKLTKSGGFSNGSFNLRGNMDYEAIINYLQVQSNRTDTVFVTFREGMNLQEYAELLEENRVCDADAFLELCDSDTFDENYPFIGAISNDSERYYKLEGYLFPDTYEFYVDEDPEQAIKRFLANYRRKMTDEIQEQAEALGMTMDQVVTLASMIQAEAANEEDMYLVSSVFHNRLNSGGVNPYNANEGGLLMLQSDATVWYPYKNRNSVPADLLDSFQSRYDTYDIEGLPPGPICNPGMAAIDAALHPSNTNYYYFCHNGETGEGYYAVYYSQHLANLERAGLSGGE